MTSQHDHADTTATRPRPPRQRLLQTTGGTVSDAFGPTEWGLLSSIALIWGSSFLFMAIGLEAFEPGVISMARVCLGAAALAFVPRARRPVDRDDLPRILFLGVIWIGIPLTLFPIAQQWIASSVAGMVNGALPLTAAFWAVLLMRRLPGGPQLAGIVVGFVGVFAISWPQLRDADAGALGTVLVIVAVVLYGLAAHLAVPLQQRYGALPVLLRAQLAGLVIVVPLGLYQMPSSEWDWGAAIAMLPLGILGTGLAFVAMTTLVGRVGGTRGSIAIYFVPVVAIVLGVVFRAEAVHPLALLGTALVLGGAWLTSRRER